MMSSAKKTTRKATTPAAELTDTQKLEQELDRVYQQYLVHNASLLAQRVAVPENRRLAVGDAIEYGRLADCRVVQLRDDGQTVLYSHADRGTRYGTPYDHGLKYRAAHWTQVVPVKTQRPTQLTVKAVWDNHYLNTPLYGWVTRLLQGDIDDAPDYQRGYVWTDADRARYLESVFHGRDLGRFLFVVYPYPRRLEVLDGKQRLNTVAQFVTSRFPYQGLYWHELSSQDRFYFESRTVLCAELDGRGYSRADLLQIFLEVNAAGVPQEESHLSRVRALLARERAGQPTRDGRDSATDALR